MFEIAILIGVYSYLIFSLGILGLLTQGIILGASLSFLILIFFYFVFFSSKKPDLKFKPDKNELFLFAVLTAQVLINLIGALGPEISFDALWYHLTIPKIFLENNRIFFIPGGLLYYSLMPKLTEMFYVVGLSLGNQVYAKLIHFIFGVLTLVVIYKITIKFSNKKTALIACLIFYANLVVGWESITAYIDLSRTFFEIMTLWGFLLWLDKKNKVWFIESAVLMGLALSTKIIALQSLLIFSMLIIFSSIYYFKYSGKKTLYLLFVFILIAFFISSPWFVFSYIYSRNPVYPLFSNYYKLDLNFLKLLNPTGFLKENWGIFMKNQDPVSPIYFMVLPITVFYFNFFKKEVKVIAYYAFLAVILCYIFPRSGARFLLPYLPALSILGALSIDKIGKNELKKTLIIAVIILSFISISYRFFANKKNIPVILGFESKKEFLQKNLNFSFGDFFDTDGYFAKHITSKDKVLVFGVHNLFYINFPFIHESWFKKGDVFNYILMQDRELPQEFKFWSLVYQNKFTKVSLYSSGGVMW